MTRKFLKMVFIGLILLSTVACGDDSNSVDTVKKLQEFTTTEKSERKYLFDYDNEWTLIYDREESVKCVVIKEGTVAECFESLFGEDCYPDVSTSKEGFVYDLEQNAIRIYFDVELEEGNLNYITYDIDKKEFILTIDLENKYYASEELLDWSMQSCCCYGRGCTEV